MEYNSILKELKKDNIIGNGKEITAYKINNKVIKIFHKDRKSNLNIINIDGLIKLPTLKLYCFNNPKELIYDNNIVVGYIEDYIEDKELNLEVLKSNLDLLYKDIITLSNNGFILDDIEYNYLSNNNTFKFIDMTSYGFINIDKIKSNIGKKFMLDKIYKDNINKINIFLIGLFKYNAFHKGEHYELIKTNKAVIYNKEHCQNIFYGNYLKKVNKKR